MSIDPIDLRVVGIDAGQTSRIGPAETCFDVHFVLSSDAPEGWPLIATTRLAKHGVAGRHAWALGKAVVVRCAIDEIETVLAALRPALVAANGDYRAWHADRERILENGEEFERCERQKLHELTGRLVFD